VLAGPLLFPLDRAEEIVAFHGAWASAAARELTTILNVRLAPPAPWVPEDLQGVPVVAVASCWCGEVGDGEGVMAPLRELDPLLDACAPRPFVELQTLFDASVTPGWHYYWKSVELPDLTDGDVGAIADRVEHLTSPRSYVIVFHLGGAVADVGETDTAYPRRAEGFDVNINAAWLPEEAGRADEHAAWVRGLFDELDPRARGVYVNFLGEEGEDRVRAAYGAVTYERLARIKARYDPSNVFHRNQNIRPAP
jgi:FAD/FMN-containing dehydrogenase